MIIASRRLLFGLCSVAALSVCAYLLFHIWQRTHVLSFVPAELAISNVLYSKQQSWGFGPGGNETGVLAYDLPSDVADQIQRQGMDYFVQLAKSPNSNVDWPGHYDSWNPTPMQLEGSDENTNRVMSYEISNYLNRYGFGIEIDSKIRRQINDVLSKPGSFAAHGRIGVLIVAPAIRRAFYVYNG